MELDMEYASDRYEIIRHGGGGAPTTLLCGVVRLEHPAAHNLVGILPPIVHIESSEGPRASWMHGVFRLMAAEGREFQPGGEAVITRLADVLVIQAIRSWIETAPAARSGWLGALQDQQIGRALELIHREPARAWTVASLANELALSRSSFAARFTELVNEPAIHYVTRWRMQIALETGGATVAELADRRNTDRHVGRIRARGGRELAPVRDRAMRRAVCMVMPYGRSAGPVRRLAHAAGRNPETEGG
jgi:AraC-like DNA-binding protein